MRDAGTKFTESELNLLYFRGRPDIASKYLLNNTPAWFQGKTIRNIFRVPYSLLVWGRGGGKTRTIATSAVLAALMYPGIKVGVFGPVKRQGDYIFNEIESLFRMSPYFQAATVGRVKRTMERNIVQFANGSFVDSMPVGDGSKIRGARYNWLFLDEYAQFDPSVVDLVIRPFMAVQIGSRPNKLIMSSSAFYKWNHLWEQFKIYKVQEVLRPDLYHVSEYDFRDIIIDPDAPFQFDVNIIKQAKESMTDHEFRMEWLREFPDDADTFFPSKLLEDCTPKPPDTPVEIEFDSNIWTYDDQGNKKDRIGRNKFEYVMGVDVGRVEGGANFAICICKYDKHTNIKYLVRMISRNGIRYQEMEKLIRECTVDYNIVRIHCDKGGGGETIRDLLREPWDDYRTGTSYDPILDIEDESLLNVEGLKYLKLINFQGNKHATLFANLRAEMEHKRLLYPIHIRKHVDKKIERANMEIKALKTELSVVKPKPIGASLKFEVPANFRKDRAVALTLAVDAALELHVPGWNKLQIQELPMGFWA